MRDAHASLKARSTLSTACTGMSVVGTVVWRCVDQPPLAAACASQLSIIAAHSCGSSKARASCTRAARPAAPPPPPPPPRRPQCSAQSGTRAPSPPPAGARHERRRRRRLRATPRASSKRWSRCNAPPSRNVASARRAALWRPSPLSEPRTAGGPSAHRQESRRARAAPARRVHPAIAPTRPPRAASSRCARHPLHAAALAPTAEAVKRREGGRALAQRRLGIDVRNRQLLLLSHIAKQQQRRRLPAVPSLVRRRPPKVNRATARNCG